jgi:uncharacterized membrane protein YdbT with pleckstrin-like domain
MTTTQPNDQSRNAELDHKHAHAQPDATILPAELLQPGEVIILLLKPSLWYLILAPLRTLIMIVLLSFALFYLCDYTSLPLSKHDILIAGGGLFGLRVFWQFLNWLSRIYVLTDQRIIRVKGVFQVQIFEAPLKKLQNTQMTFLVRERLFGLGSIHFYTAGTNLPEASWEMINRPLEAHQTIIRTMNKYR